MDKPKRIVRRKPVAERFWKKVNKTPTCWLWTGATRHFGYGHINRGTGIPGDNIAAHRLSWELTNGPVPTGLFVLHKTECNTPRCVRPEHLYLGTHSQNMTDASKVRTHNKRKLTDDQVREIRARYAAGGESTYTLAAEFAVNQRAVWEIVRRTTYIWLT